MCADQIVVRHGITYEDLKKMDGNNSWNHKKM